MNDLLKFTIQIILTTLFLNLINYSQRKLPEPAQQKPLEDALDVDVQIILWDIFHGKEAIAIADFPRILPVLKRAKAQGQVFVRQHLAQGIFANPKGNALGRCIP